MWPKQETGSETETEFLKKTTHLGGFRAKSLVPSLLVGPDEEEAMGHESWKNGWQKGGARFGINYDMCSHPFSIYSR